MKQKALKYPYTWEERRPYLWDGVLYIPDYYSAHADYSFPGWQSPEVFGNDHPVVVEYCSGNGSWIADRAARFPDRNWVAVEKRFDRVRKIWSKAKNYGLANLFVVAGDAVTATRYYFPQNSVEEIHINFPDPWPKEKHAKHRLVQAPFAEMMGNLMSEGGVLTLVTDDVPYSEQMIEVLQSEPQFASLFEAPYYRNECAGYGTSFFEELWREKGRLIRYHQYRKEVACLAQL